MQIQIKYIPITGVSC